MKRLALVFVLVLALAAAPMTAPAGPSTASGDVVVSASGACPAVWDPVICSDGQVYSNACYARLAHAKGCVSTGGGPVQ